MRTSNWRALWWMVGVLHGFVGCDSGAREEEQGTVGLGTVLEAQAAPEAAAPVIELGPSFMEAYHCVCAATDCRCKPLTAGGIECFGAGGSTCDCACDQVAPAEPPLERESDRQTDPAGGSRLVRSAVPLATSARGAE
jgi:hypothetical protein